MTTENTQMFPLAAVLKNGYVASSHLLLKAYVWRMGGDVNVDFVEFKNNDEDTNKLLCKLMFPLPYAVELECEVRALIAKIVVADGLWNFTLGAPFNHYTNDDGVQIYTDDEARQIGELFVSAVDSVGYVKTMNMVAELMQILVMP
jgi:hypothetical protein